MVKQIVLDKLSVYIPQTKLDQKPVECLMRLSEKKDRSVSYLVVDVMLDYLKREERT